MFMNQIFSLLFLDLRFFGDKNDLYMIRDYKIKYGCEFEVLF